MAVLRKQKPWLLILGVATTAILLVDTIVLNSQAAKVAVRCLRSIPLPSDWRARSGSYNRKILSSFKLSNPVKSLLYACSAFGSFMMKSAA